MVRIASVGVYDNTKVSVQEALNTTKKTFLKTALLDKVSTDPRISSKQIHPYQDPHEVAIRMAKEASEEALFGWDKDRSELTHLFFACSTYVLAPTLEIELISELSLPLNIHRTPILMGGCVAAPLAIRAAYDAAKSGGRSLVLCLDLVSPHMYPSREEDINTAIAQVIFSDGAAACIIDPEEGAITIEGFSSYTVPKTTEEMKLMFSGSTSSKLGLLYPVLSPKVHLLMAENVPRVVSQLLGEKEASAYLFHPGGKSILGELEKRYKSMKYSWEVLDRYGNMSSPSCLYVLYYAIKDGVVGYAPLVAFAQGVHIAGVLLHFD